MKTKLQLALQLTFLIVGALFLITVARGQFLTLGVSGSTDGGGPGACSNKLDFTDACNSQYIAVIF